MLQSVGDLEICWSDQYEIFPLKNNQRTASEDSCPYTAIAWALSDSSQQIGNSYANNKPAGTSVKCHTSSAFYISYLTERKNTPDVRITKTLISLESPDTLQLKISHFF